MCIFVYIIKTYKHMKNLLITLILFIFISNISLNAQSDYIWEPIGLTLTGSNNIYHGVEAYYRLTECNGEYFIILKFINTNEQKVMLEWKDAIFTNNQEWITNNDIGRKSLTINPNSAIFCNCSQPIEELFVKVKDFISNVEDFRKYRTVSFKITFIEE